MPCRNSMATWSAAERAASSAARSADLSVFRAARICASGSLVLARGHDAWPTIVTVFGMELCQCPVPLAVGIVFRLMDVPKVRLCPAQAYIHQT